MMRRPPIMSTPDTIRPYTTLFRSSIHHVNNETCGSQPMDAWSAVVRKQGGLLFADCSQAAGKLPLPQADMIAISAHKFGGPSGVGALLIRDLTLIHPSGGQEQGYRDRTSTRLNSSH